MNEYMTYLLILTCINVVICKLYQRNKYIHTLFMFVNFAFSVLAFNEIESESYQLPILSLMMFNFLCSIFLIIVNSINKPKNN